MSTLKLVLGLAMLVVASRQWRKRPRGDEDAPVRMSTYNAAIMAVICLVIGAKLIGDALPGI